MIIAEKLSKTNRAEYLLYLWQVEDLLRAYDCDAERIGKEYLSRFTFKNDAEKQAAEKWYADFCSIMKSEGLRKQGHLPISRNVLQQLSELHAALTNSPKYPSYQALYLKVLPYIVELRKKNAESETPELQTCFELLYGVMMLRLQKRPVSPETATAAAEISALLARLSDYYFKDKEEPLEF